MRPAAIIACCLFLAACGSDDEQDGGGQTTPGPEGASLTVTLRPEGKDGPTRVRRIECARLGEGSVLCRRLEGLTRARLAPVPAATACAELYGGPATARVSGELRGEQVDAHFDRVNGCEINRWDENRALLGRASL
jgi:hypothetical protein